jgi:hypothetical protein
MRVQDTSQGLLYYVFLIEKSFRVDVVAEKIGCAASTIYDFAEGRRALTVSFLIRLFLSMRDTRLLDLILKPCGMTAVPIADPDAPTVRETLTGHLAITMREVGHVTEEVLSAIIDGAISRREAKRIREEIHHAQTALSTLAAALPPAEAE